MGKGDSKLLQTFRGGGKIDLAAFVKVFVLVTSELSDIDYGGGIHFKSQKAHLFVGMLINHKINLHVNSLNLI